MLLEGGAEPIILPDDLEWTDEYTWSSVTQDVVPTIGGGLVISEGVLVKGRPLTLVGGENVWTTKSVVDNLMTLINTVDKTYTLTLPDARVFTVKFKRDSGSPIETSPVFRKTVQDADSPYLLTLRLMEV